MNHFLLITVTDVHFHCSVIVSVDPHLGPCSRCVHSHGSPHHLNSACRTMPSGSKETMHRKKKRMHKKVQNEQKERLTTALTHKHSCLIALYTVKTLNSICNVLHIKSGLVFAVPSWECP